MILDENYWSERYQQNQTGWDVGEVTRPLKLYFDQLNDKGLEILIPGGGNGYEAGYLYENGFNNVYLLDFSKHPLENFKKKYPDFPEYQLLHEDFFKLNRQFDLMIEQTFFCAIDPSLRKDYARKAFELLRPGGRLVGLLWDDPMYSDRPPFGGSKEEYVEYFKPYFDFHTYELCHNSITPRAGRELFVNLIRKAI
jgi:methyl halide transferase